MTTTFGECRSVDEFERLNHIDEGTYGVVYRARCKRTGEIVALKKIKIENQSEGFPITALREIRVLMKLHHPNVLEVREVAYGKHSFFLVMEYLEHNLKTLVDINPSNHFQKSEVKALLLQLLSAAEYLHQNWVIHRDLKTSNLLLNNRGCLKVADFGMARQYGSPLEAYTSLVVTLWYRSPELLLGKKEYTSAVDIWSIGCIFAEFITNTPLFPGRGEIDQLDKIFGILGTPNEQTWPGVSLLPHFRKLRIHHHPYSNIRNVLPSDATEATVDLLNGLLTYDPAQRLTATEALNHPFFEENPPPKPAELMPTFKAIHEESSVDRRRRSEEQSRAIDRNADRFGEDRHYYRERQYQRESRKRRR